MQPFAMLSFLALTAFASALPSSSDRLFSRSGCDYNPGMKNADSYTTTPLFLLRIENASNNKTLGYIDAFSSDYAILSARNTSSAGFIAPYYNGYGSLIFWNSNGTDRAFTAGDTQLPSSNSTLPVTTLISTQPDGLPECGTAPVYMHSKYSGTGSCVFGGEDVDIHFRCPVPGTSNDTPSPCYPQSYYACNDTGLPGVSNEQSVIYFGNATTAAPGPNWCAVDLVSECP